MQQYVVHREREKSGREQPGGEEGWRCTHTARGQRGGVKAFHFTYV